MAPLVGAPITRRLYELTGGAVTAIYAVESAYSPPMNWRASPGTAWETWETKPRVRVTARMSQQDKSRVELEREP